MRPFFYVVAGPNGVGKSTAAFQYLPSGVEVINSDDIARQLRAEQSHQEVIQQMTNDESQRRIQQHLHNREPFAVETNLHEMETWQYFIAIQQSGYEFRLLFLCTSALSTLNSRVLNRHLQGGHFVREDVVRGRYVAGLSLLNHFFDKPDSLTLVNAEDRLAIVYQRVNSEVMIQREPLPAWVITNLATHFSADSSEATPKSAPTSIDEVRTYYQQQSQPPSTSKNPNEPPTF